MRRQDREITDIEKIHNVIDGCTYCRIGFCDKGEVYIVPLNFGVRREDNKTLLYFHSAKEGRKISLIEQSDVVGFEMDRGYSLKKGERACEYTASFESIIGSGKISFVRENTEKITALNAIMRQSTKKDNWEFSEKMLDSVCVFKIEVKSMSCKIHE